MLTVTADELATMIGVSPRTVRDLAGRGIIVRAGRGRYEVVDSVARYCETLREAASGRGGEGSVATLSSERARLAREQADAMALKNAALRRDLVPAEAVEKTWAGILIEIRGAFLALPARVQQRIGHLTPHDLGIIEAEVRDMLREASA